MKQFLKAVPLLAGVVFLPPAVSAEAPAWIVDDGSTISFTYRHDGKDKQGHFVSFTADIHFDPADPATADIAVQIDLASVSAGTQDADDSLKSSDWFNVKAFPEAVFKSTSVTKEGDQYVMAAALTIRGQAVPVELPFTLELDGGTAHAVGSLTLDRTAFGLGGGFWANPAFIGHEVQVQIDLKAHKAK